MGGQKMKTFVKLSAFLFIFLTSVSRANPIMMFFITEVQLDEDNSHGWKMELFNLDTFPSAKFFLTTQTDTAFIKDILTSEHYFVVITEDSLAQPLSVNPDGDIISIWISGEDFPLERIIFGNIAGAQVAAPLRGQSICIFDDFDIFEQRQFYFYYLDDTPTLGSENDLAMGTVNGYIKDSDIQPVSNAVVTYQNELDRSSTAISDSDGFFSFSNAARTCRVEVKKDKYAPRDTLLQVWPDSLLSISLQLLDSTSGIGSAGPQYANAFALEQNYPNPFNAQTIIKYYLPVSDFVEVAIYDITGRKMETLESGYIRSGEHRVAWNAADYASGIYVYKLITSEGTVSRKCMLIK